MNLIKLFFYFVSIFLVSCAVPQQQIIHNKEHIRISLPRGWCFYDGKHTRGDLPFTLIPSEDNRLPSESTTAVSFYASRNQVLYFPKNSVRLDSIYCEGREIKLWFAETYLAKYILSEFPYGDGVRFATLVVSSKSDRVFEERKVQFLNVISTLAQSR